MSILFSIEFLFFFLLFFIMYWLCSPWVKIQNVMLLTAGYIFVGCVSIYSLLILISWSLCIYTLVILAANEKYRNKVGLMLSLMLAIYFITFKYFMPVSNWLLTTLHSYGIQITQHLITILLPLGLSFYLFNSVSLVLSIARKEITYPGIVNTFLYINFIPTIIAGPINRAEKLIPQFSTATRTVLEYKRALYLIAIALIKLFLLSSWLNDNFASPVFEYPEGKSGWDSLLAVYGWAWNIYFNFSGYSNLVTGIALLLGFRIPRNFEHPYQATSLRTFWHDWHISLSEFIRDYLYLPLGGNRKGLVHTQVNILIVMIVSGIWHGAGLTFFIWGALHGLGLVIYNLWQEWVRKRMEWRMPDILARLLTFHFVCLSWVFFAAASCGDAFIVLSNIAHGLMTVPSAGQGWALCLFIGIVIIYPELVKVCRQSESTLCSLKGYALPLVILPLLALAFFFAPSGLPGFIYATF